MSQIQKIIDFVKSNRSPFCVHDICRGTGISESNACVYLYELKKATKNRPALVVKCLERGTCSVLPRPHNFWNYSGVYEREFKRSAQVGAEITEEYEQKIADMKEQLKQHTTTVTKLACFRKGCDKPVHAKGMCKYHYDRHRKNILDKTGKKTLTGRTIKMPVIRTPTERPTERSNQINELIQTLSNRVEKLEEQREVMFDMVIAMWKRK